MCDAAGEGQENIKRSEGKKEERRGKKDRQADGKTERQRAGE